VLSWISYCLFYKRNYY